MRTVRTIALVEELIAASHRLVITGPITVASAFQMSVESNRFGVGCVWQNTYYLSHLSPTGFTTFCRKLILDPRSFRALAVIVGRLTLFFSCNWALHGFWLTLFFSLINTSFSWFSHWLQKCAYLLITMAHSLLKMVVSFHLWLPL